VECSGYRQPSQLASESEALEQLVAELEAELSLEPELLLEPEFPEFPEFPELPEFPLDPLACAMLTVVKAGAA
jgi:hypothetical protein